MDEKKDRRYIKEIIKEYNARFATWGPSDTWDLDQFKTLENLIFDATDIDVNANTLKRFFQQRTGNPQLATRDALCRFLGYTGYTDFVLKQTQTPRETQAPAAGNIQEECISEAVAEKEQKPPVKSKEIPVPVKKSSRIYLYVPLTLLLVMGGYLLYTLKLKDWYTEYLISKIKFSAVNIKGAYPLTATFSYKIPPRLLDNIQLVYEEANGDTSVKKLTRDSGRVNATYIAEGDAFCHLQYKGQTLKTINVESRKPGWSVFTRNERKNIFKPLPIRQAYTKEGYVSLPLDSVPPDARPGHLFVSYVYYKDKLVDGDNFILEARVRNSAKENAIPQADEIMYILSDTGMHGFAMNENGYAYIKFISGEKTIKGDDYNLSRFRFNPSEWHVMSIKVANKKSAFYVDGEKILDMEYNKSIGTANELILRFKGCGAVDYVRLRRLDGSLVYEENFDSPL
ncbi:hypothetical protein [Niabella ginsenosidivorans]|nr:hypothetical protein [Niabella ginsenosidivorans]